MTGWRKRGGGRPPKTVDKNHEEEIVMWPEPMEQPPLYADEDPSEQSRAFRYRAGWNDCLEKCKALYPRPQLKRKPLTGENTTFAQRFTDAVAILCAAEPPSEFVSEWLANVDVDGVHRLQEWVLNQEATPSWAQGIGVLDAAHVMASQPVEGEQHEGEIERLDSITQDRVEQTVDDESFGLNDKQVATILAQLPMPPSESSYELHGWAMDCVRELHKALQKKDGA